MTGAARERRLSALATRQHGVVARRQLTELGFGNKAIRHRLESGRLQPLHRAVYLVGHRAAPALAVPMGAVLAAGPGSVLSHRSAAALFGMVASQPPIPEVSIVARTPSRRGDLRMHRAGVLPAEERALHRRIPVTSPARTLLDLAARTATRDLRWAIEEARVLRLLTPTDLDEVLARHPHRPGAGRLRRLNEELFGEPAITRSEAERLLADIVRQAGLPRPRLNVRVHGWSVDAHWPAQELVAEVDGFAYHSGRAAFERDRRKDAQLQAHGLRVVRLSWRQLAHEPASVAALLTRLVER